MNNKNFGERSLLILCFVLGSVLAWISRYDISGDGISYLDVGDAYFRRDWAQAINGYWSPMYCWCLGLAMHLLKPGVWREFVVVHAVNLLIYFFALFCFRFFLHAVLREIRKNESGATEGSSSLPEWVLLSLGYGIFLWAALILYDIGSVTPDLLVAGWTFLIGGYLVGLRDHESYSKFAVFGILCGLAYLGKAIMFPLGFILLAAAFFSGRFSKRRIVGVMLAGILFLVVSAPFIAALSRQKGRLTFGDSGRIAYAAMVNPEAPPTHWQGEPEESGIPKHATRKILDDPPVYEFAQPVGGTFPPWYDPSYWNDGLKGTFRLRAQIRVLVQSARNYTQILLGQLGLLTGLAIFLLWGGAPTRKAIAHNWPLVAVALLSLGLYSVVLVRTRYVGAFLVFLLIAILAGIRLPANAPAPVIKCVALGAMGVMLFSIAASMAEMAYMTMTVYSYPTQKDQIETAVSLQTMGLRAGDPVAVIGDGRRDYWARLGRFKIVAEILSPEAERVQFWSESWDRRKAAYESLRHTGAKLLVVWSPPRGVDPGWKRIPNTNYYAYDLSQ
jgi:hypothetical protein